MNQLSCGPLWKENNKWENVGYLLYYLVLNFWLVVRVHGFVHGFAHGIGARWFLAPGIFLDPVKGTMVMF